LVVVRNSDRKSVVAAASSDTIGVATTAAMQPQIVSPSPEAAPMRELQVPAVIAPSTRKAVGPPTQKAVTSGGASSRNAMTEADFSGKAAVAGGLAAAPQAVARLRSDEVVVLDAAKEQAPLKVVGTPRTIGAKVTLYEVEPGDTVTFTEPSNVRLEAAVVTAMSQPAQPQVRRSMEKSAVTTQAAVAAPATPSLLVEVANGVTTISWPDATTGNMLKLSGRLPVERLKEIKLRIERERAAAAAKKSR
jgi:plastocyanin